MYNYIVNLLVLVGLKKKTASISFFDTPSQPEEQKGYSEGYKFIHWQLPIHQFILTISNKNSIACVYIYIHTQYLVCIYKYTHKNSISCLHVLLIFSLLLMFLKRSIFFQLISPDSSYHEREINLSCNITIQHPNFSILCKSLFLVVPLFHQGIPKESKEVRDMRLLIIVYAKKLDSLYKMETFLKQTNYQN